MSIAYHQATSRYLPARYQAALLFEFARTQDIDDDALLRNTRLRAPEVVSERTLLTPGEYLQLIENLKMALPEADTSLLLGQQLLPGSIGGISHALHHARDLRQALDILVRYQSWLSPLLAPHLMVIGSQTVLYWTDACVTPRLRGSVVDMMMAAVTGMTRWLSGERLPWQYRFNRTQPACPEQYTVHLGTDTRFNDYLDAMAVDNAWLDRPWPRASDVTVRLALSEAERLATVPLECRGLLPTLYEYLLRHVRQGPTLEKACADLGISPATFKRHLAQHGSHFQAELDQVRAHVTLRMICADDCSNEQIADYLGFHDANNFRRSFKRWTGLTPSVLRTQLLGTDSPAPIFP